MLHERDDVLGIGDRMLLAPGSGPRALVVTGPPGAGTSAVLDELVRRWPHVTRPVVVRADPTDCGRERGLLRRLEAALPGPTGTGFAQRVGLAAATDPLLLVVDDLHWSDAASFEALGDLIRAVDDRAVAVVLGGRPTAGVVAWTGDLDAPERATWVELAPLGRTGTSALLAERLGAQISDEFVDAAHAATGGVPGELVRVAAPLVLREAELSAVIDPEGLTADERTTLESVEVLGGHAPVSLVAAVTGLPAEDARITIDRLVRVGVLVERDPGVVAQASPSAGRSIRAAMGPATTAAAHRRAYTARRAAGDVLGAAAHAVEGDLVDEPGAADTVGAAASEALALGNIDVAVAWSAAALRLAGAEVPAGLLRGHGDALVAAGQPAAATLSYRRALAAEPPPGASDAADLLCRLARALAYSGDLVASESASRRAWQAAAHHPLLRVETVIDHVHAVWQQRGPAGASAVLEGYEATDELPDDPRIDVMAGFVRWWRHGRDEDADHLIGLGDVAAEATQSSPYDATLCATSAARYTERFEDDEPRLRAEIASAEAAGRQHAAAAQQISLADSLVRQGRPAEALALLDELRHSTLFPLLHEAVDITAAYAAGEQGRADVVTTTLAQVPAGLLWSSGLWTAHLRALALLLHHDHTAASDAYRTVEAAAADLEVGLLAGVPWAEHAIEAHRAAGRPDDVVRVLALAERATQATTSRWVHGVVHRGRAALAELEGDLPRAEQHLATGVAVGGPPLPRARLVLHWAELRRGHGRRAEARPLYRDALETFERAAAAPLVDRCQAGLRAAGGRRSGARTGRNGTLTDQERRVAELAGRGRLTREIAAELFISPKTVETHLRHVFDKVGVRSKRELQGIELDRF